MKHSIFNEPCVLVTIFLTVLLLVSCEKADSVKEVNDKKYKSYTRSHSIDSDFVIWPREVYKAENELPQLTMEFRTKKIYPCINFGIAITQEISVNTLIVRFDSIIKHDICLTAIGPASAYIPLPENIQQLVLINGESVNVFDIQISASAVTLSPQDSSFTEIMDNKWFRYPENTFAFVCGTNTDNKHLCSDFTALMEENLAIMEFAFDGEGVIPYPDSSSGHWNNTETRIYSYSDIEEFHKAGELLKDFTRENISPNDGVTIRIINWKNQQYRSWMMYDGR